MKSKKLEKNLLVQKRLKENQEVDKSDFVKLLKKAVRPKPSSKRSGEASR